MPLNEQLLFMKTGSIGSAPNGFYQRLANAHNTEIHNPCEIRAALEAETAQPATALIASIAREETTKRVVESLNNGQNTFFDGYLNYRHQRNSLRKAVSEQSGLLIVTLAIEAPKRIRLERIKQKYGYDPDQPLSMAVQNTYAASRNMQKTAEIPTEAEPHLRLDGTQDTPALLDQIATYIAANR